MKNSDSISVGPSVPSLFQLAAFFEDFFPASGWAKSLNSASPHSVAEYMLNPEKLMSLLISCKTEGIKPEGNRNSVSAAAGKRSRGSQQKKTTSPPPPSPSSPEPEPQRTNNSQPQAQKNVDGSGTGTTKKIEFTLSSPAARSVKLAGDFTEWESHPVEMMHSNEGVWHTVVPLPPGSYSYRFIVDGEWCDDPNREHVPNPYGGENAVIHVT